MDKISHNNDYADLLRELNAAGAEYIVVGAHAVSFHGYIRASGDFDVWVRPTLENARRVYAALQLFGAPTDELSVEDLTSDDLIFQIGVEPVRIDVITTVSGLDFDEAWKKRQDGTYLSVPTPVLGLEELIRNKRASGRPKDLTDVEELRRINPSAESL
ncbi:MAG TPA: hypothetical protein VGZ02_16600 [Candidatus Baltobacteraceae bacterium]|jgi:hypothetical protein|nr:hypothetical protein [Candidatus Baltobacteraceae bacterium]